MLRIPGIRRLPARADQGRHASPEDIDAEMVFHIESRIDDLVARGVMPDEARRLALADFGDRQRYRTDTLRIDRQSAREVRVREFVASIVSDLVYAARGLRRTPAFTFAAIATLALGIGATTAVFSAVSGVLLRPLPFADARRIVHIGEREQQRAGRGGTTSYENFDDWRRMAKSFDALGLYSTYAPTLTGHGDAERVEVANVTKGLFDVFRIKPFIGRSLEESDNDVNAGAVAVLSHDFWRARFGSEPGIVGQTIQLNFAPVRVVGVLPPGFHPPQELDRPLWLNFQNNTNDGRGGRSKRVYAHLRDGITLEQARAEMSAISARLAELYPDPNRGEIALVDPIADIVYGDVRKPLYLLLGASALVLLIACANLSNLLLARGQARDREIAIRTALGAGRRRIARQLLTENVMLSVLGSAAGLTVAVFASRALVGLGPSVVQERPPHIDGGVLLFTILTSLLTALLFGLVPTARLARRPYGDALRDAGMRTTRGKSGRTRTAFALAQLSLAVMLLTGSSLVLKSFARVLRVEPGVNGEHVLTASLWLPRAKYDSLKSVAFYDLLESALRGAPGVVGAAFTSLVPFSGDFDRVSVSKFGGRPEVHGADAPDGDRYVVSPTYFATMGVRVLRGRLLTADDRYDAPVVCVVDEVFARHAFAGADPIGQTMKLPQRNEYARIVGVVTHVKTYGLDVASPGQIYISNAQFPWRWMSVVIRTSGDPSAFTPTLLRLVKGLDPDQPVSLVNTMDRQMSDMLRNRRFTLVLLGAFAGVAIALAAVGLYGVIAYGVSQRRRELGVRLALGAQRRQIAKMILSEGARIAVGGAALGALGAIATGKLLASLLFEVNPRDPVVLALVSLVLVTVAVVASLVPARRATRVSAAEVMRGD